MYSGRHVDLQCMSGLGCHRSRGVDLETGRRPRRVGAVPRIADLRLHAVHNLHQDSADLHSNTTRDKVSNSCASPRTSHLQTAMAEETFSMSTEHRNAAMADIDAKGKKMTRRRLTTSDLASARGPLILSLDIGSAALQQVSRSGIRLIAPTAIAADHSTGRGLFTLLMRSPWVSNVQSVCTSCSTLYNN